MKEENYKLSKLDVAKSIVKKFIKYACFGIFDTRNILGDHMVNLYDDDELSIDICYGYEYFEVFGLTDDEFNELEEYYEKLKSEIDNEDEEDDEK